MDNGTSGGDNTTETTQTVAVDDTQETAQVTEGTSEDVSTAPVEQPPVPEPSTTDAPPEPVQPSAEEIAANEAAAAKEEADAKAAADAQAAADEAAKAAEVAANEKAIADAKIAADEAAKAAVETPPPAPVEAPIVEPTVTEPTTTASVVPLLTILDADTDNVKDLKLMLAAFIVKNSVSGTKSIDFLDSAKQASTITNYIIAHPRKEVLDLFLAFITENANGVASRTEYSKGVDKLSSIDEKKINYLYNVFLDISKHSLVGISTGVILSVLRKPEIVDYYTRKLAFFRQEAGR